MEVQLEGVGASPRGFGIPQIPGAGWGVPHPARTCFVPLDPALAKGPPELPKPCLCRVLSTTRGRGKWGAANPSASSREGTPGASVHPQTPNTPVRSQMALGNPSGTGSPELPHSTPCAPQPKGQGCL